MTIQEMRIRKKELALTNERLSQISGVPLGTVQKVMAGITESPRWDTMLALESVLTMSSEELRRENKTTYTHTGEKDIPMMRETEAAYKTDPHQGSYTVGDYLSIPPERRVELIDGYIFDMASPNRIHQLILGELYSQFHECVEKHPECELYMAPSDVRIDNDDYTVVQPDLYVVCNYEDMDKNMINTAPDFIAEVLSPSNRYHDMYRKLNKYRFSGVKEYWIIDPQNLKIIVHDLAHDALPETYQFSNSVPVLLSDGECEIDFSKIYSKIAKFY